MEEQYYGFALPHHPLPPDFSHTDLGCGSRPAHANVLGYPDRVADIGIDCTRDGTTADRLCQLGIEPLPLESHSQDLVTAYDLLEHIPKVSIVPENGKLTYIYPTINLINEVYRVLKPGGYFESLTPGVPHYWHAAVRDPTHVSFYSIESSDYFCTGRFEKLVKSYGLLHPFEKITIHWRSVSHIQAVLQKPMTSDFRPL